MSETRGRSPIRSTAILRLAALLVLPGLAGAATWTEAGAGAAGEGGPGLPGEPDPSWRHASLWDDGRAEFCAYEAAWRRYGRLYPGRALLVLVKEPWAPELEVKADRPRPDGFEVLKLNHLRDVPTGIYTYHQMASVFLRRDSGELRKLTAMSAEACGISAAQVVDGRLRTWSYFDGQGNRTVPFPGGALPEDGLPAILRDYVRGTPPEVLRIFPSLLAGRFPPLEASPFRVAKGRSGPVDLPAGTSSGVEIRLQGEGRSLAYLFAEEPPHRLLRFTAGDGTEYRLAKCQRIAYWGMQRPGDEAWYPEGLR